MVYKATFNLPDKNYYTGAVKGNGITLGMTDGTNNFGTVSALTSGLYAPRGDIYGHAVQQFYSTGADRSSLIIGVTTDSSKSGIIVEPDAQLKLCIKY